jgi:hypothetical protein
MSHPLLRLVKCCCDTPSDPEDPTCDCPVGTPVQWPADGEVTVTGFICENGTACAFIDRVGSVSVTHKNVGRAEILGTWPLKFRECDTASYDPGDCNQGIAQAGWQSATYYAYNPLLDPSDPWYWYTELLDDVTIEHRQNGACAAPATLTTGARLRMEVRVFVNVALDKTTIELANCILVCEDSIPISPHNVIAGRIENNHRSLSPAYFPAACELTASVQNEWESRATTRFGTAEPPTNDGAEGSHPCCSGSNCDNRFYIGLFSRGAVDITIGP